MHLNRKGRGQRAWLKRALALGAIIVAGWALSVGLALPSAAWGQSLVSGFPRIGTWSVSDSASASSIARFDCVVMGGWQLGKVKQAKVLNPGLIALWGGNACEMALDPSLPIGATYNRDIAALPASWMLTQVGSRLVAPVSATATSLHVVSTSAAGKRLFIVGDTAVIDREVVLVTAVGDGVLTVRRGVLKAPSAHTAGARVASTVKYFPRTVVMDLSTYCPLATANTAVGPENWAGYHARTDAAKIADPAWDGIYLDRSDGNESWILNLGSSGAYGRTIDPSRSNTPVIDRFATFNAAWNTGLRAYEQRLRGLVGDRILLGNEAYPNFDLLNGTVMEEFPGTHAGSWQSMEWPRAVFGTGIRPSGQSAQGSYTEWLDNARQPGVTTVMTYQDDRGAAGTVDYRKMRFGLATALMGDGLFTYEAGGGEVPWMDEYDGGSLGRGYLGTPVGPAYHAIPPLDTPDLNSGDGAFDNAGQLSHWTLKTESGYAASARLDTSVKATGAGSVRIDVTRSQGTDWKVRLGHPVVLPAGGPYTLTFKAKADHPTAIGAYVDTDSADYTRYLEFHTFALSDQWQTFEIPCDSPSAARAVFLRFAVGASAGSVWIDDAKLQAGDRRDVYRRDFTGGVAVVNASAHTVSVDLGGAYQRLVGTQAPSVNDGTLTTSVTLGSEDGIVLVKPGAYPGPTVERIAGMTRYETCEGISKTAFPSGSGNITSVIVASGSDWMSALPASVLAATLKGPLLLTRPSALSDVVPNEIGRLGATNVYLAGGSVNAGVEASIRALPGVRTVTHIAGPTAADTARDIASLVRASRPSGPTGGTVFLGTDAAFADCLSASSVGAASGSPVLLTDGEALSPGTASALRAQQPDTVVVCGGTGAVSDDVLAAVRAAAPQAHVIRKAGIDRYATARSLAEYGLTLVGIDPSTVYVASGADFPDALGGAVLTALGPGGPGMPLVLTRPTALSADAAAFVDAHPGIQSAVVLGGAGAVSPGVVSGLRQHLH